MGKRILTPCFQLAPRFIMLIDSHCHLDAAEFDADRAAVLERARAAGITRQIIPATTAAGWEKLRAICAASGGLLPAYGLHPMFLAEHRPEHLQHLREWIERACEKHEYPVAIGECGLDYYLEGLDRDTQQRYFEGQLRLAREFDLPVIVHARRAVEAVIVAIGKIGGLRGVVHSYAGSVEQARQLHEAGFLIGLGGPVTYSRARRLRRLARDMPLEQLLLETDAPDQPDSAHRGQRNEPARLTHVRDTIAELRDVDPGVIASATTANAERLFGLDPLS